MEGRMQKLKKNIKRILQFLLNPRFLLCFGIGWLITNGWAYVVFATGTFFGIKWMIAVGGGYLTLLWLPFSPEKIITVAIAIWLLKIFFPQDTKTLAVLKVMYRKIRNLSKKRTDDNSSAQSDQ
jgi:hypothetical protein